MTDIKFIAEYRTVLLDKIETVQIQVKEVVDDITNELRDAVNAFSDKINMKLKVIEEKFTQQQDELEKLRVELQSKQFDEKNFNNVSVIKNQSKQITEKENKIRELENRIKYLESNNTKNSNLTFNNIINKDSYISNETKLEKNKANINNNNDEEVEIKISRSRSSKISSSKLPQISEEEDEQLKVEEEELLQAEKKLLEVKNTGVKHSKKPKIPIITPIEEIEDNSTGANDDAPNEIVLNEENISKTKAKKVISNNKKSPVSKKKEVVSDKQELVSDKKEVVSNKKEVVSDKQVSDKKEVSKKKEVSTNKKSPVSSKKVSYPDVLPDLKFLDVITLNNIDYYEDNRNNNVYQIIEDEEIGAFLGIYDKETNQILSP